MRMRRAFDYRLPSRFRTAADLLLLLWAAVSLPSLPFDPRFPHPPGEWYRIETKVEHMKAEEVDALVTRPLSTRISSLSEVDEVYASSTSEMSRLLVETPSSASKQRLRFSILKACERVHDRMPHGASDPLLLPLPRRLPPVLLGLEPDPAFGGERIDIGRLTERLRLERSWAEVSLFGEYRSELHIEVVPSLLAATRLEFRELVDCLRDSLFSFSAGGVVEHGLYMPVELTGGMESGEELRSLVVRGRQGEVPLPEIARIERTREREHAVTVAGRPALLVSLGPLRKGGGAVLGDLMSRVRGIGNRLSSRHPGWRVSTLYDPYSRLLLCCFLALLCPFAGCLLSHVDQTQGAPFAAGSPLRLLGKRVRRAARITALLVLLPSLLDIPVSYALLPAAAAAALLAFRLHVKTLLFAAMVPIAVFLPYSTPSWSLQPSFPRGYRRFFIQSPPGYPRGRPADESGGTGLHAALADEWSGIGKVLPGTDGPWRIPSEAVLPLYSRPLRLVSSRLSILFIAADKTEDTLTALRRHGISPFPTLSADGEIDEDSVETLDFLYESSTVRGPLLPHGELGSMFQAAVEGLEVGAISVEAHTDTGEGVTGPRAVLTLDGTEVPVRLYYGRARRPEHFPSLPVPVSGKPVPLRELGTLETGEEPSILLSKNGTPLDLRLLPLSALGPE